MALIELGGHRVGNDLQPFVAAEVGINHNGSIDKALEMIHVAKESGCDAVKFQTFRADEFVNDHKQTFTYKSQGKQVTESMLEMFRRYELPKHAWKIIKNECDSAGIMFFSTPQNSGDLDILLEIGVPAIKVGSDDFTNLSLLTQFSKTKLPLILSTGMSDLSDVYCALESVGGLEGYPVVLLVCTSQYPTPPKHTNLSRITTLRNSFPTLPIGFSDHTRGPLAASIATGLGACFLEKHFTLDNDMPGPDHWFSANPTDLKEWVTGIRKSHEMLGDPIVRPTVVEREHKLEYQRRIVASQAISPGDLFTAANLSLKRVQGGRGLSSKYYSLVQGKPAGRRYNKGEPIDF